MENLYEMDKLFEGKAKSKIQRRLFGMAYAYKKGNIDESKVSQEVKLLADSLSEDKLKEFASTNEKKRKKDGSIGKRNAIPYKVKK